MNTKNICILFIFLLLVVWGSTAFAKVTATVDRTNIVVDESLTLTITRDGISFFTDPDLKPLQKDFKVAGQSQQSSTQIINGAATSTVSWHITLLPRHAGTLTIPSLAVGKEKTSPVTVQVSAEAEAKTRAGNAPIFIETEVDEQSVFVQAQLLYTLRVYGAVNMQIIDPGDPDVADTLIEKLEDATFDKVIDGTSYKVFERKYALFPQKSGMLKIPQLIIQVQVPSRNSRRNFFDPFGSQGEILKFRSTGHEVVVKEKPGTYPASAVWLPADGLILKEQWVRDPQSLAVGQSATLNLSIIAEGLTAGQLPPVEMAEPDGMKVYQGKAEVDNITTATGIIGTRKESIALIPTRSGEIELPEIRIPWWDKEKGKVEYAVIPARKFVIQGSVSQPEKTVQENKQSGNMQTVPVQQVDQQQVAQQSRSTALMILSVVLAVAWFVTLLFLFRIRRQLRALILGETKKNDGEQAGKERQSFKVFADACRTNDPVRARAAVLLWSKVFLPDENIQTLGDVSRVIPDSDLAEMDTILYRHGTSPGQWQGDRLLAQVKKVRTGHRKKKEHKEGLQELYR